MGDSGSDSDGSLSAVTSILGIKGPLRFRPHGSTQKAHIVLRRVELSDDSDDDGNGKSTVYFSLFAQKRIEVKPGKEILLTLSDGKYKDQAIIFEGDLPGEETSSDEEDDMEMPAEEPVIIPPAPDILPPKMMRRTWTKRTSEQVSPMNSSPPPPPPPEISYASIAVQAEPTCVTASVQTVILPSRIHTSSAVQTTVVTRDAYTPILQTDQTVAQSSQKSSMNAVDLKQDTDEVRSTRSLSPMELDSPSSTPPQSPALAPAMSNPDPLVINLIGTSSRSGPESSNNGIPVCSGRKHGENELVSVQQPFSTVTRDEKNTLRSINKSMARPIPRGPAALKSLTPTNASSVPGSMYRLGSRDLFAPAQAPRAGSRTPVANGPSRDEAVSLVSPVTSKPSVPAKRKPVVANPFVSAGFMTEFVGSSGPEKIPESNKPAAAVASTPQPSRMRPTLAPLVIEDPPRESSASPMEESPISVVKVEVFSPALNQLALPPSNIASGQKLGSLSPMVQSPVSSTSSTPHRLLNASKELPRSTKNLSHLDSPFETVVSRGNNSISSTSGLAQSTAASVSAPVTRRMSPPPFITPKIEPITVQIPQRKSPIRSSRYPSRTKTSLGVRHPLPPKPVESSRSLATSRKSIDFGGYKRASSPPDPKSIAYISSGPSSNPLGIRPSSSSSRQRIVAHSTAPTASGTSAPQQKNKKPIIVGSGWPYTRPSGGLNSIALGSSNASSSASGSRTQVITSESKVRTSQPSSHDSAGPTSSNPQATLNIVSYSSPSPPSPSLQSKASNGMHSSKLDTGNGKIGGKKTSGSSNSQLVNGRPAANDTNSEPPGLISSCLKAIKSEPLDEQLPPDPHFAALAQNDQAYPLLFDFTDPPPLPRSKTKARDPLPKGPRMLDTTRSVTTNQANSPARTPHKALGALNGTSAHPLPPKPLPISRRESDYRPRGIKRGISPMSLRPPKRSFLWPVVESTHRVRIKGDGNVGIKGIAFSSDGSQFVVNCDDRTIRIWNNRNHTEVARLAHNSPVVSVAWMQGDAGILSLGEDGIVSKWTRTGQNHWQWAKIVDAGTEHKHDTDAVCFAYMRDRIAISFPKLGVKVWQWIKGTWQQQRSILRQNVTSIKFVEDGEALIGGTRDGVLWYCEVPNGTLRAYSFLKSKVHTLDVNSSGNLALVAQTGGRAHLVGIKQNDSRGKVEQVYAIKDEEIVPKLKHEFGAMFANQGQTVLFGCMNGCVLVWDKNKGNVVCGLDHCEDDIIQAIAIFDRNTSSTNSSLITGTKQGLLNWWSQPSIPNPRLDDTSNKKIKRSPEWD